VLLKERGWDEGGLEEVKIKGNESESSVNLDEWEILEARNKHKKCIKMKINRRI